MRILCPLVSTLGAIIFVLEPDPSERLKTLLRPSSTNLSIDTQNTTGRKPSKEWKNIELETRMYRRIANNQYSLTDNQYSVTNNQYSLTDKRNFLDYNFLGDGRCRFAVDRCLVRLVGRFWNRFAKFLVKC